MLGSPRWRSAGTGRLSTPSPCPLSGPEGLGSGEDTEVKDGLGGGLATALRGLWRVAGSVFPLTTHTYSSSSSVRHLTGAKPSEGDTQWALPSLVWKYRIFHSQKFSLGLLLTGAPVVYQRGDRGSLKTNSACCPTPSGETTPAETCVGGVDLPRHTETPLAELAAGFASRPERI